MSAMPDHAFTADGELVFMDAFGLTYMGPEGGITDMKVSGGFGGLVTLALGYGEIVAYSDGQSRAYLRELPTLRKRKAFPAWSFNEAQMHPEGDTVVAPGGPVGEQLLISVRDHKGAELDSMYVDLNVPSRATIDLSRNADGQWNAPALPFLVVGPEAFCALLRPEFRIAYGHYDVDDFIADWTAQLHASSDLRTGLYPDADGLVLVQHDVQRARAHIVYVDSDGQPRFDEEREAITLPSRTGSWLAWQRDDATVERLRLDDGSSRAWELPEPDQGLGRVFVDPSGGMWFVPWQALEVVELETRRRTSRGLPDAQNDDRIVVQRRLLRAQRAAAQVGTALTYKKVDFHKSYLSLHMEIIGQPRTFTAALVVSACTDVHDDPTFDLASHQMVSSGHNVNAEVQETATEDDVVRAFEILDSVDVRWIGSRGLGNIYERHLPGTFRSHAEAAFEPVSRDGEKLLLLAYLESLEKRGDAPSFVSRVGTWREAQLERGQIQQRAEAAAQHSGETDALNHLLTAYFAEDRRALFASTEGRN